MGSFQNTVVGSDIGSRSASKNQMSAKSGFDVCTGFWQGCWVLARARDEPSALFLKARRDETSRNCLSVSAVDPVPHLSQYTADQRDSQLVACTGLNGLLQRFRLSVSRARERGAESPIDQHAFLVADNAHLICCLSKRICHHLLLKYVVRLLFVVQMSDKAYRVRRVSILPISEDGFS